MNAERSVVGAILLDARFIREATDVVSGHDFADPSLGIILDGMAGMVAAGEPVDVITVAAHLDGWGVRSLDAADLHVLAGEVLVATNVRFHAEIVRKESLARQVAEIAARIERDAREPDEAIRGGIESLQALTRRSGGDEDRAYMLDDFLTMEATHDWLVPGLLERRDRMVVTGFEGFGKSALMQQLGYSIAAGTHPFHEVRQIEPRRVLFLDAENTAIQWSRRIRVLHERMGSRETEAAVKSGLQVRPIRRADITRPQDRGVLHRYVDEFEPDVLFIGPLYRLTRGGITNDDDAAPVLAALDEFRDRGLALVIEAHAGKSDDGKGNRNLAPRGSAALLGWPEFGYGLGPRRGGQPHEAEFLPWRGDRESRDWPRHMVRGKVGAPWQIADEATMT